MIDLDELQRLHEAATPGPWRVEDCCIVAGTPLHRTMTIYDEGGHGPEEAALIAAMRNALPELLRLARRARRLEEAARYTLDTVALVIPHDAPLFAKLRAALAEGEDAS